LLRRTKLIEEAEFKPDCRAIVRGADGAVVQMSSVMEVEVHEGNFKV
jgi:hypothetical protein